MNITCPECKNVLHVAKDEQGEEIVCEWCGAVAAQEVAATAISETPGLKVMASREGADQPPTAPASASWVYRWMAVWLCVEFCVVFSLLFEARLRIVDLC